MKYSGSLVKEERASIFKLFLDREKLKFNEIEKEIKISSNMVAYHIEKMQKEGLLEKKGDYYYLTKNSEKYIPIFSHLTGKELSPLPVILVAIVNKNKILMIKRNKRPYKNYWSMIGGKMLMEETFESASVRQVKEKTGLDAKFISINSVMHERVEGQETIKHSFILFFTKMATSATKFIETENGKLKWFTLTQLKKEKVIPSDRWLIENKLNSNIEVKSAFMTENEGELTSFKILR